MSQKQGPWVTPGLLVTPGSTRDGPGEVSQMAKARAVPEEQDPALPTIYSSPEMGTDPKKGVGIP